MLFPLGNCNRKLNDLEYQNLKATTRSGNKPKKG
jgi:hypothetical protein